MGISTGPEWGRQRTEFTVEVGDGLSEEVLEVADAEEGFRSKVLL